MYVFLTSRAMWEDKLLDFHLNGYSGSCNILHPCYFFLVLVIVLVKSAKMRQAVARLIWSGMMIREKV